MSTTVDRSPAAVHHRSLQGDSFEVAYQFDFDATGYAWTAQLRRTSAGGVAATYTVTDVVAGGNTTVTLKLAETDTPSLTGQFLWDLQHDGGGDPNKARTLLGGTHTFDKEVTR